MADINFDETINVCSIGKYLENIKGLKGSSTSPTDTWIINFKENIIYDGKPIKKGFLKIFVNPDSLKDIEIFKDITGTLKALQYEMLIYKDIITPLLDNKICPNFVRYLGNGVNCTYNDLLKILIGKLTYEGKIITTQLPYLLKRNIYSLINKTPRLSIDDITDLSYPTDYSLNKNLKFDIILTEAIESKTLFEWIRDNMVSSSFNLEFWNIVFQICIACYAMSLSLMVHNDLHAGNIFIKDLGIPTNLLFYIDDKPVIIKTKYVPLIYDFDRSYVERGESGENKSLNGFLCSKFSQCNIFVPNKDIIKIFCYMYLYVRNERNNIIALFLKPGSTEEIIETFNLQNKEGRKNCFLQYIDTFTKREKSIPVEWYSKFYSCSIIIDNIIRIHLTTYPSSTTVLPENVYHCNKRYFDPVTGALNLKEIKSEKLYVHYKMIDDDAHIISSIEKMIIEDGRRKKIKKPTKKRSPRRKSKT